MNRLVPLSVLLSLLAAALVPGGGWAPPTAAASAATPRTAEAARGAGEETLPAPAVEATWPLRPRPRVVARFAPPVATWGAGHRGVDLLGTAGQTVRAAKAGPVLFAGRIAGRGVVVVGHGSVRTTYEPVEASVAVGDQVRAGGRIGRLALFGSHCFPRACLHWGLREGDGYLDPLTLVGAGPVRLLPWLGSVPSASREPLPAGPSWEGLVPQLPSWRPAGSGPLFRPDQARGWAWR